jgi:hypothetical protein
MTLSISKHRGIHDVLIREYGEISGMKTGRGNRSTRRKPAPLPLCSLQFPFEITANISVISG